MNVNFLVGNIEVAANNQFLPFLFQLMQKVEILIEKLHFKCLSNITCCARGYIIVYQRYISKVEANAAPFNIIMLQAKTINHIVRLNLTEDRNTAIAFLLRTNPIV